MSLTEKYRPLTFSKVRGQDTTVSILKNILKQKKGLYFSYVFSGPWGSGKSTLARIFAKSILCDQLTEDLDPCNDCESCLEFDAGRSALGAYREIDSASNSSKDFVKELVENGQIRTFSGKKRIWLFDEAHQLTSAAADVLLKPVEDFSEELGEKDVVCIFCTTSPERLKSTIKSRCLRFEVDLVSNEAVEEHLKYVAKEEGIEITQKAIAAIVQATEGHLRDALQYLEYYSLSNKNDAVLAKISGSDLYDKISSILLNFRRNASESIKSILDISKTTLPAKMYRITLDLLTFWIQKEVGASSQKSYPLNEEFNLPELGILLQCLSVRPSADTFHERYLSDILKAFTMLGVTSSSGTLSFKAKATHQRTQDLGSSGGSLLQEPRAMEDREYYNMKNKLHIDKKINVMGKIKTSDGCCFPISAVAKTPVDEPSSGPITLKADKKANEGGMDNLTLSEIMQQKFIDSPESVNKDEQG